MIQHMAIFRWKDGVTPEQVDAVTAALTALPQQIDVLRQYVAGPNIHVRPSGADYGVVAIVDDEAGVDAYLDHPAHKAAVEQIIGPLIAERTSLQLRLE